MKGVFNLSAKSATKNAIRRPIGSPSKNQRGQLTLEALLIMTVLLAGSMRVYKTLTSQEWAKKLVEGPWKPLQGMIEDGEWSASSKASHPNLLKRHGSKIGDEDAE